MTTRGKKRRVYYGRGRKNGNRRYRRNTFVPIYDKPELKFIDTELENQVVDATWEVYNPLTVLCLNAVAQGDTPTNRDGRCYYIHSVMMKIVVFGLAAETATAPFTDLIMRILLVHDKQANQGEADADKVMETAPTIDYLSFRNLSYTGRFRVIKDKTILMRRMYVNEGVVDKFATGQQIIKFDWYHTFAKPLKVICNGTAGNIAVVTNNSLQVIAVSNSATEMSFSYQARCRFSG